MVMRDPRLLGTDRSRSNFAVKHLERRKYEGLFQRLIDNDTEPIEMKFTLLNSLEASSDDITVKI